MTDKKVMLIEMSAENEDDSSKQYVADIYMPANLYEIDDAIDKCRGYLVKTDIMPYSITNCQKVPLLNELRFDGTNLYELNFLAKQIVEFDNTQLAAYNALLPLVVGENYKNELVSIKDVINLTYSVDDFVVAPNIFDDEDLGKMLIDNEMVDGMENLSDQFVNLLDPKKVGKEHRMAENGVYINGCYVAREGFKLKEIFNGETLPEHTPDNYLFRFHLSNTEINETVIDVPFNESTEQFIKNAKDNEFNLIDFESAIPQISRFSENMHVRIDVDDLNQVNEIAKDFLFLDEIQTAKFKAALCYEGITTLEDMDEIEYILKNVDLYNLKYLNVYPSDFAKDYLEQHLDDAFPKEYLDLVNTNALGDRLMEELDGAYTPYGILLKSSNEQIFGNESKQEFMLADFLSKHVLFTEDRLKAEEIPEGLYKYELRSGPEDTYAALEEKAGVDFSGTILSKVPFDLGEDEYIDLENKVDGIPDFLDVEMNIAEFMNSDFDPEENEDFYETEENEMTQTM